jgi:2-haloacid dehalogenase
MAERWATFDCYGTLIDWRSGITAALAHLWPDADRVRLLHLHEVIEPLVQEHAELSYREVLARTLRAIAAVEALLLSDADDYALAESLPLWKTFAEVPEALSKLRADGWRLAILSNTDPPLLEASMKQIGVPIDLAITAAEAGSYKPAHGHWQRFFEQTAIDRSQHVHVAASLFHDIAPAQQLGLRAVWINRLAETSALPRDAELPDLRELPLTLERLVPRSTET